MRMRSVPGIEAHLIESAEPPTGVGEVSVPPVAPALANAEAALTGTRDPPSCPVEDHQDRRTERTRARWIRPVIATRWCFVLE
jgi:hypothetical protein